MKFCYYYVARSCSKVTRSYKQYLRKCDHVDDEREELRTLLVLVHVTKMRRLTYFPISLSWLWLHILTSVQVTSAVEYVFLVCYPPLLFAQPALLLAGKSCSCYVETHFQGRWRSSRLSDRYLDFHKDFPYFAKTWVEIERQQPNTCSFWKEQRFCHFLQRSLLTQDSYSCFFKRRLKQQEAPANFMLENMWKMESCGAGHTVDI